MSETSFLGPMTENLMNGFVDEIKKRKYREKIMKNVVDPILEDINNRYFPHMMTLLVLLALIIILLLLLLIANVRVGECCQTHKTK